MNYGNQITKDTLRQVLDTLPPTSQNDATRGLLVSLLTKKQVQAVPYTYVAEYSGASMLTPGATNVPFNINIQADADFLILSQTYESNVTNLPMTDSSRVIPLVSVILTDTGSSAQMSDRAVPVSCIFGTGQFPFILPNPKLMASKSTLQILASNYADPTGETDGDYNLRLCFNGVKLFSYN